MLAQIDSLRRDATGSKVRLNGRVLPALLVLGTAALLQSAGVAEAASPTPTSYGLYNTGVGPSGVIASQGIDPDYMIGYEAGTGSTPDPGTPLTGSTMYVTDPTGLPFQPPDNSTSAFISPFKSYAAGQSNQGGIYDITTTFTLSSLSGLLLYGRFESDDRVNDVVINGVSTGIFLKDPDYLAFSSYFNLSSYLKTGTNTIDFKIYNFTTGSNTDPVALRAEFTNAVPEPSIWAAVGSLAALSLLGRWLIRRRMAV